MLLLHINCRCMLETLILFSGIFIRCESSGNCNEQKNVSYTPKNTWLIVHMNCKGCTPCEVPAGTFQNIPRELKYCFDILEGAKGPAVCNSNDYCNVTLKKDDLSKQDIVVLANPISTYSCPDVNSSEPGYLHRFHTCLNTSLNTSHPSIRLTERKLIGSCGKTFPEEGFTVILNRERIHCIFRPDISITLPATNDNEAISPKQSAKLLKNLSSVLEQMGNSSTAAIVAGNVKGAVAKLPPKDQTKISFGFGTFGNISISQSEGKLGTSYPQTVEISEETCKMAVEKNGVLAAVMFFPWIQQKYNSSTILQNQVVGIEMGARICNLSDPIAITFNGVQKDASNLSCTSWDGEGDTPVWVTDGCETRETNSSVTCVCSHLTFFAVLVTPVPETLSASDLKSLTYITSIGCGLSLFFQVVALFMHYLIRKGKSNLETKILIQLFIAMFFMNLSFLVNESIANLGNVGACVTIAAVLHYSLLATFTWFFMQALHLFLKFRNIHSEIRHYLQKIYVAGWVTPAVVVSILLALQKYELLRIYTSEGEQVNMCWISDAAVHQGVNIGYYSVVFTFTLTIFIIVLRQIPLFKSKSDQGSTKIKVSSVVALFFLLGLTWAFAFFSHGPLMLVFYYIFTTLNAFQGFFLFIYYYKFSKISGENANHPSSFSSTTASTTDVHSMDDIYTNQSTVTSESSE